MLRHWKRGLPAPGTISLTWETGKGESVLGVIHAFEQASGHIIPVKFSERRQGDVASCYAEADKARQELNWKAEHDLQTIARDYCHWLSLSN